MNFIKKLFAPLIRKVKKGTHKETVICNKCGRVWTVVYFDPMTAEECQCPNCGERDSRIYSV